MKILLNYKSSDLIFFDIETARVVEKLIPGTPLHSAWQYKARYQNEMKEKLSRDGSDPEVALEEFFEEKSPLYAPFARIACIVVGRIDGENLKVKTYAGEEDQLLTNFMTDLSMFTTARPGAALCGFNNIGFDQPMITKRSMVNNVQLHPLLDTAHLKPWEINALDLSTLWKGASFYPDSLVAVATALGLPSPKTGMDGAKVSEAFYAGKIDEIVEYCKADVLTTANIYRRFSQKSLLKMTE